MSTTKNKHGYSPFHEQTRMIHHPTHQIWTIVMTNRARFQQCGWDGESYACAVGTRNRRWERDVGKRSGRGITVAVTLRALCKMFESMQLDRATGAKCYTLSARSLYIAWRDTPQYWEWIDLGIDEVKRFSEAAKLHGVWWLDIRGKINRMMLSENLTYAAYMVFKLADDGFNLLHSPFQDVSVSVAGSDSTQQVCLQSYMEVGDDGVPQKHILTSHIPADHRPEVPLTDDIVLPRERADGWMEVELGEFYNEEGFDDEMSVSLMETRTWKYGLIVWGIEIRVKK
uniref:Uncharacterized protein n=1 Tax=Avena sativa TaxID=4498 RepID=A0ACD6AKK8_AVESA